MTLFLLAHSAAADDARNHEFAVQYLSGTYTVVGKVLDGEATYTGEVRFQGRGDGLAVTRVIHGERSTGVGTVEHALGPDAVDVLRVRFTRNGRDYEITYLWQSDLDNYPRLTGYLYRPGRRTEHPGLEALFVDRAARDAPGTE